MIKPYEKLARFYYDEWGDFSLQYLQLIDYVASEYGFVPDSILDIACGTGNLIKALASIGKHVVGCDISAQMIAVAKENNPDVEFHLADMTRINLNQRFDMTICAFDSINYLLAENKVSTLFSVVHRHLVPGGFFLFDVNTSHIFREQHGFQDSKIIGGIEFTQFTKYDEETELAYTVFDFNGGQERHTQKAYDDETITRLLQGDRFEILDTFANIAFAAPVNNAKRLIYVVRKPQVS